MLVLRVARQWDWRGRRGETLVTAGRGAARHGVIFLDSTGIARKDPYIILRHEETQTLSDLCKFLQLKHAYGILKYLHLAWFILTVLTTLFQLQMLHAVVWEEVRH